MIKFRRAADMKKISKKFKAMRTVIIVIIAALLFVPFPTWYKDGGTVIYRALFYSVTKRHELAVDGGYYVGTEIKILGFEVFSNVKLEK